MNVHVEAIPVWEAGPLPDHKPSEPNYWDEHSEDYIFHDGQYECPSGSSPKFVSSVSWSLVDMREVCVSHSDGSQSGGQPRAG